MDKQDYLNQISAAVRPEKKSKMSFMSSPFFKVILVGVVAFIVVAIAGNIISSGKMGLKDQIVSLKLNLDNTLSVVSDYQNNLKSSDLRSSSASLYGVLSNTSREVKEFLQEKYNYKDGSEDENIKEEANTAKDALVADLFEAKINGTLDRIYAHKMTYQISSIMSKEASIYNASGNESLREIMESSYNSLTNLYEKFSDFSETK